MPRPRPYAERSGYDGIRRWKHSANPYDNKNKVVKGDGNGHQIFNFRSNREETSLMRKSQKKEILDILDSLQKAHEEIKEALAQKKLCFCAKHAYRKPDNGSISWRDN